MLKYDWGSDGRQRIGPRERGLSALQVQPVLAVWGNPQWALARADQAWSGVPLGRGRMPRCDPRARTKPRCPFNAAAPRSPSPNTIPTACHGRQQWVQNTCEIKIMYQHNTQGTSPAKKLRPSEDITEFLKVALPCEGHACTAVKTVNGMRHRFFSDRWEAAAYCVGQASPGATFMLASPPTAIRQGPEGRQCVGNAGLHPRLGCRA